MFNSDCFQVSDLMRVCVMCNRYFWVRSDGDSYFLNVQSINKLQGTKVGERHRCCHVCAIFVSFVPWHSASQPSGDLHCFSEHLLFVLVIEFANWNSSKKTFLLNFITCSFTAFPLFHSNSDLCYEKNECIKVHVYQSQAVFCVLNKRMFICVCIYICKRSWLQWKYCAEIVCRYWERLAKATVNTAPNKIWTQNMPNTKNECCLRGHNVRGISSVIFCKFPVYKTLLHIFSCILWVVFLYKIFCLAACR